MTTYVTGQAIVLFPVVSSIFFFLLFSSPNLSRRRLDVCHTCTHGVAFVRIRMQVWNMLHAARWNTGRKKLPKICHLGTIEKICLAISLQLRHISKIEKNLLNSNNSSTCPYNMVYFGPLAAEIGVPVWSTPANFNGFASWQRYCTAF